MTLAIAKCSKCKKNVKWRHHCDEKGCPVDSFCGTCVNEAADLSHPTMFDVWVRRAFIPDISDHAIVRFDLTGIC